MYKAIYESITELGKQKSTRVDESTIEKPVSNAVLSAPDLSRAQNPSRISNESRIQSIPAETLTPDKEKEDEALDLSIPYDFLPYKPLSGEFQQEERGDMGSSASFISPIYNSLPEDSRFKKEAISFDLAGIGSRVAAFIIDLILILGTAALTLGVGLFFTGVGFSIGSGRFINVLIPIYLILLFLGSTYFVFLEGFTGKTIGKMILGIRIIRDDGESMRLWEAFVRWLGYFVSAFFIFVGFIWAIFDSKNQTWHDKFAGTYVVKE